MPQPDLVSAGGAGEVTVRSGRVKRARRLLTRRGRDRTGEFLAEGPQAVREAIATPGAVREVFATQEASERHRDLVRSGVSWLVVPDEVVATICETVHPQGMVARCRKADTRLDALLARSPGLVVVGAGIADPGNAGTVLRCADAAGADAVVLAGDGVDPYNPKAVRASAGSLFHLDVVHTADSGGAAEAVARLRAGGLVALAADGTADLQLPDASRRGLLDGPTAWVFGNEAHGVSDDVRERCDHAVAIPIYGRAESLNLATAAAVCLYASAAAQRRDARPRPR